MKKGFSLAELLITLSVIGVVAALSIPNLVGANQKKVYAASLATVTDNMSNAFNNMLTGTGASWLEDTELYSLMTSTNATAANIAAEFGKYADVVNYGTTATSADDGYSSSVLKLDGSADAVSMANGGIFLKLKSGALIHIVAQDYSAGNTPANSTIDKQSYTLTIDINGAKEPNRCGRDIFKYLISNDGKLYPFGGKAFQSYTGASMWDNGDINNNATGSQCCGCASGNSGWGCAARLHDNGFVMDY